MESLLAVYRQTFFPTLFSHAPTSRNAIQHISTFAAKTDWCVSFSAIGISLRPGEVEMKILQSWWQALLTSPPPQSSRGSRQMSRETQINLAQNKSRVKPKWRACSQARISRAITFCFNSKIQWQMFLFLYGRHVCVPPKDTDGVSIQSSINLGDTLLQITRIWKTAKTWFLARLFVYVMV